MRYVVRLYPFRQERVDNVKLIKEQIPELEIVQDKWHNGYETFFRMCELIKDTGALTIEDDVILCKNFKQRVESIISDKGYDKIYSFFEKPKTKLKTAYLGGSNFFSLVCVYFPPGFTNKLLAYYKDFVNEKPEKASGTGTDCLVSYVLVKEKMKYWRIRPTMVQHLDFSSTLGRRAKNRQTPYFVDYEENDNEI